MPYFGMLVHGATPELLRLRQCPATNGAIVAQIYPGSIFDQHLNPNDTLLSCDNHTIDSYMFMNWNYGPFKLIEFSAYFAFLGPTDTIKLSIWSHPQRSRSVVKVRIQLPELAIRNIVPVYQPVQFCRFAGLILCNLTRNHVRQQAREQLFKWDALNYYMDPMHFNEPAVLCTFISPNSFFDKFDILKSGMILHRINDHKVTSVDQIDNLIGSSDSILLEFSDNIQVAISRSDYDRHR